jgi:hypothetical protein
MPRTTKTEIDTLRKQLEVLSAARHATLPSSNVAMVGIRNISDYTIGIPSRFGEPELQLFPDLGANDPNSTAVVSFAFWRALIKERYVTQGMIVRDDTILGVGYTPAPEDRAEDYSPHAAANRILDPVEWIESRSEPEIREALAMVTSEPSLRRIRRGVDLKLRQLQASYADTVENKTLKSWEDLPMVYRFIDDYTTRRLERPESLGE